MYCVDETYCVLYTHTMVPCRLDLLELHSQKQASLDQHISAVKQQKEVRLYHILCPSVVVSILPQLRVN